MLNSSILLVTTFWRIREVSEAGKSVGEANTSDDVSSFCSEGGCIKSKDYRTSDQLSIPERLS